MEGWTEPDTEPVLEHQDYVQPGETAGDQVLVGIPKGNYIAVEFSFYVTSTKRWILRTRVARMHREVVSLANQRGTYDNAG